MSPAIVTVASPDPHDDARNRFSEYAMTHSSYAPLMVNLYAAWGNFNARYFGGRLKRPHLTFGRTPPRGLAFCKLRTDWGGVMQITLKERVALGRPPLIRRPWPSPGTTRFLHDLVLHEQVHQHMFEVAGNAEEGYRGHGPGFARECNRIGSIEGLAPVVSRRRAGRTTGQQPLANYWPINVRPQGYYLGDVALDARTRLPRTANLAATRNIGVYEFFLALLIHGETETLRRILERQVDWARVTRSPALGAVERRPHDETGTPRPLPALEPAWLQWNSGCVRKIADCIRQERGFADMPILADALEERVKQINGKKKPKEKVVKARTPHGVVLFIPALDDETLLAELATVADAVKKKQKHGLPRESLPQLLKGA